MRNLVVEVNVFQARSKTLLARDVAEVGPWLRRLGVPQDVIDGAVASLEAQQADPNRFPNVLLFVDVDRSTMSLGRYRTVNAYFVKAKRLASEWVKAANVDVMASRRDLEQRLGQATLGMLGAYDEHADAMKARREGESREPKG